MKQSMKQSVTVVLAAAVLLASCSDDEAAEPEPTPSATEPTSTQAPPPPPPLPVNLTVDKVDGVKAAEVPVIGQQVVAAVAPLLTSYVDQAFRSDQPAAYDAFTPGAAALAQAQPGVVTRAGFGEVPQVTATRLNAALEVFAPKSQPSGITARLDFAFDIGGREATVTGRLLLSPEPEGWKIFGFDLAQTVPDPAPAPAEPAPSTAGGA